MLAVVPLIRKRLLLISPESTHHNLRIVKGHCIVWVDAAMHSWADLWLYGSRQPSYLDILPDSSKVHSIVSRRKQSWQCSTVALGQGCMKIEGLL